MKYLILIVIAVTSFTSCSSDDSDSNLLSEFEIDNTRFLNPYILGTWEGVDECEGDICFGMPIEYDQIIFKSNGDFINDRTELSTDGEIKNTFGFFDTNQFIISELESNGSTYNTYQRIITISVSELVFEEFKDSEIGDYGTDEIIKYTFKKISD